MILAGLEWQSVFVYLNDILVASFSEHLEHLIKEVHLTSSYSKFN